MQGLSTPQGGQMGVGRGVFQSRQWGGTFLSAPPPFWTFLKSAPPPGVYLGFFKWGGTRKLKWGGTAPPLCGGALQKWGGTKKKARRRRRFF